jgi:hypothetical protein
MSGGFAGVRPSVSQKTKDAQYAQLKPTLDANVKAELDKQVPDGYVLLPGASWTTYEPQPDGIASAGTVDIREKALMTVVIFSKMELAKAILSRTLDTYANEPVQLRNGSALTLTTSATTAPTAGTQTFAFSLAGTASIEWIIDPAKITSAVAGKNRSSAKTLVSSYPEVESALLELKPFWTGTFPTDTSKIQVKIQNPGN